MLSLGFRVWGLGFGVWGLGFRVRGFGFGVQGLRFRLFGAWGLRRCLSCSCSCSGIGVKKGIFFSLGYSWVSALGFGFI